MIRNVVRVKRLGRVPYEEAYKIQLQCVEKVLQRRSHAQTLLLLEHTPVYTVGIRGKDYCSDSDEANRLRRLGADFVKTNRGGLITFHGPGQLIAYPILDLNSFKAATFSDPPGPSETRPSSDPSENRKSDPDLSNNSRNTDSSSANREHRPAPVAQRRIPSSLGVKWYVAQLEGALVQTCYEAGVQSAMAPGFPKTGVWTGNDRKIASIGIHTRDAVTSHGIALNCDMDLKWFRHIVPCGLAGCQMTSLSEELGKRVSVDQAAALFLDAFKECLQCDLIDE